MRSAGGGYALHAQMATTLEQPTDRRGGGRLPAPLDGLSRRERIALLALAVVLLLTLAVGVGSAVGGGVPFVADDEEARGPSDVPSDWGSLEPLLPLAPSLKEMAALKSTAAGGFSGVLAAESGSRDGGGALRLRALPAADAATGGGGRGAAARAPSGRPRPTSTGSPPRTRVRVPLVRRILATRVRIDLGFTSYLQEIIEEDLRNLTGLPLDIDLGSFLGIGAGQGPLTLTVVDSRADSRFDVLLVARGRRLLEAYRFRDRDIAGLAAQINLRSRVLVADVLRDGTPLARVTSAPLRSSDAAAPLLGSAASGLAGVASRGGRRSGAAQSSSAGGSSAPENRSSQGGGRRLDGRSVDGSRRSSGSAAGASTPHRATPSRRSLPSGRSTPTGPRRSSPGLKRGAGRGGGRSKARASRGRGSPGGHAKGDSKGRGERRANGKGRDEDGDD